MTGEPLTLKRVAGMIWIFAEYLWSCMFYEWPAVASRTFSIKQSLSKQTVSHVNFVYSRRWLSLTLGAGYSEFRRNVKQPRMNAAAVCRFNEIRPCLWSVLLSAANVQLRRDTSAIKALWEYRTFRLGSFGPVKSTTDLNKCGFRFYKSNCCCFNVSTWPLTVRLLCCK